MDSQTIWLTVRHYFFTIQLVTVLCCKSFEAQLSNNYLWNELETGLCSQKFIRSVSLCSWYMLSPCQRVTDSFWVQTMMPRRALSHELWMPLMAYSTLRSCFWAARTYVVMKVTKHDNKLSCLFSCTLTLSRLKWWTHPHIDWCCFYYFLRNSLVALLEALFARIFSYTHACGPCLHGMAWSDINLQDRYLARPLD